MKHPIFEVNADDFGKQVLESALPVLVEFTADWCPPCKMIAPILHEVAQKHEGRLRVAMLDSDTNQPIVQQYGVMGLPTMILFVDGSVVERIVGYQSRERIEAKLLPYLSEEHA